MGTEETPVDPAAVGDETPSGATRPEPRRRSRFRPASLVDKLLLGVGLTLVVLAAVGALGAHVVTNRVLADVQQIPDVFDAIDPALRPQKPAGAEKTRNFLLVGVDSGTAGPSTAASDAVMMVHLAADRRSASVVSIPRNSWVRVPGRGTDTVSSAYLSGGPPLLVRTVEQLTGLRVDNFVVVDFAGFRDITDAVGGVDVRTGGEVRTLDGDAALAYVRQRPGRSGDLGRVEHQQQVMKGLMAGVGSRSLLSSPTGTFRIADSIARAVKVDESFGRGELRSFAFSLRHLKPAGVRFETVPVRGTGRQSRTAVTYLDATAGPPFWQRLAMD